jgi:hypothetical protein
MFRYVAGSEALGKRDAVGAGGGRGRQRYGGHDHRGARAMLGARVAVDLRVRIGAWRLLVLMRAVVVRRQRLEEIFLLAGSAKADRDRRDAAQRHQGKHRDYQQKFRSSFHGTES